LGRQFHCVFHASGIAADALPQLALVASITSREEFIVALAFGSCRDKQVRRA